MFQLQDATAGLALSRRAGSSPPGRGASALPLRRVALVLPAAALTLASFVLMDRFIRVDMPEPELKEVRVLTAITPNQQTSEPDRLPNRPDRLPIPDLPPVPPPLRGEITEANFPYIGLGVAGPTIPELDRRIMMPELPVIPARDIQPLTQPVANYPDRAARDGIEGDCEIHLKVDRRGQPFDIDAVCSHPVFERAAEAAVARVEFAPRIVRGQAVEQHGVIYPMVFRLD